jgi:glycosyltransferase involved in cell wall biosynthesis
MYNDGIKDWRFILAGGVEVGVGDYVNKLKNSAEGYPVEITESPDYKTLKDLYGRAKIFWSASGFGENEDVNPEKVEHFGITIVEAMTGGCVPLAYDAGGHREIIVDGENGMLWSTILNLTRKTQSLIADSKLLRRVALNSKKSAEKFSEIAFEKNIVSDILQK